MLHCNFVHCYKCFTFAGKFAHLLRKFWSGRSSVLHPADFKKVIAAYHPQFRDHRQVRSTFTACTHTGWSKKMDTQFYFWDNFGNLAPILTILLL